ncbi:MAG: ATP-binding protein [bacterium]|nr:ATP-binding protein [bacterium]
MELSWLIVAVEAAALIGGGFLYAKNRVSKSDIARRESETSRRMYELAILKELGDRIGYSLNVQQIIDVITGSLHQFIPYSVVSYMLLEPEHVVFKAHLERSVHRAFIDDVRSRMLKSLSALLDRDLTKQRIEEVLSGAILLEDIEEPVGSFFNIPIVIGEAVVGVLTVAHTTTGLYQEAEMTILYKITNQASQAVTKLQDVVKTEERKLNAMMESMDEGVVMTDRDFRLVVANPAARAIAGIANAGTVSLFDFVDHLGGKFDIHGKLDECMALDRPLEVTDVAFGDRIFHISVAPVKSSFGLRANEVLGGVVIFRDVSHEKELERLRNDFTSMLVHELRSPLDGIHKITDLAAASPSAVPADRFIAEFVPIIRKSSSDMLSLVNTLLDAAKVEAGKFEVRPEPYELRTVIADRIAFFRASADAAGVVLTAAIAPSVPPILSFDPHAVGQVLTNLISNALKFTQRGGVVAIQAFMHETDAAIAAEAKVAGVTWFVAPDDPALYHLPACCIIAVTDTGVGISAAELPLLFNKFKQFRSAALRKDAAGSGLGLVIAKGMAEAHGGRMGVASNEGRGTTFYFTIPITPAK